MSELRLSDSALAVFMVLLQKTIKDNGKTNYVEEMKKLDFSVNSDNELVVLNPPNFEMEINSEKEGD